MKSYYYPGLKPIPPWVVVCHGLPKAKQLDPVLFARKYELDPIRVTMLFSGNISIFWHELCAALATELNMSTMFFYNLSRRYSDNLLPRPATSALALTAGAFLFTQLLKVVKVSKIRGRQEK